MAKKNKDAVSKLYNNLVKAGVSLESLAGGEEQFRSAMSDSTMRKRMYDWLSEEFDMMPYDRYEAGLSAVYQRAKPSGSPMATPPSRVEGAQASAPMGERVARPMAQPQGKAATRGAGTAGVVRPSGAVRPASAYEVKPMVSQRRTAGGGFSWHSADQARKQLASLGKETPKGQPRRLVGEYVTEPITGAVGYVAKQRHVDGTPAPAMTGYEDARSGEVIPAGDPRLKDAKVKEPSIQELTVGSVASKVKELDKRIKERGEQLSKAWEESGRGSWWAALGEVSADKGLASWANSASSVTQDGALLDEAYNTLRATRESYDKAGKLLAEYEAAQRDNQDLDAWRITKFGKSFGRGFVDGFADERTWANLSASAALSGITKDKAYLNAIDAYEAGKPLTKEQEELLEAKAQEVYTIAKVSGALGSGYNIGESVAGSSAFAIELAMSLGAGGISAGNRAIQSTAKWLLGKFGARAVSWGAKGLAGLASAPMKAVLTGSAGIAQDAARRMAGQATYRINEGGEVAYAGNVERKSGVRSMYESATARMIEHVAEEVIGDTAQATIGKAVGFLGSKAASVLGKTKAGKAILAWADDAAKAIKGSTAGRAVHHLKEATKLHGLVPEYIEEVGAGMMNALLVGDQTLDTDPETGVFNLDNNIDTFLSVAIMQGAMGAVSATGYRTQRYRARQAMGDSRAELVRTLGGTREQLEAIEQREDQEFLRDFVVSQIKHGNLSPEQKTALLQWARNTSIYLGAKQHQDVEGEAAAMQELDGRLADAHDAGRKLPEGQEQQQAWAQYELSRKKASETLGDAMSLLDDEEGFDIALGQLTGEARSLAEDYLQHKATYEGVMAQTHDAVLGQIHGVVQQIDERKHENGRLVRATLTDDRVVYLKRGNVALTDDGTMVNIGASDADLFVVDAETGKLEMTSPRNILRIDEDVDAEARKTEVREELFEEVAKARTRQIKGFASPVVGLTYTLTNERGEQTQEQIIAINQDGSVTLVNAAGEQTTRTEDELEEMVGNTLIGAEEVRQRYEARQRLEAEAKPSYEVGSVLEVQQADGSVLEAEIVSEANADGRIGVMMGGELRMLTQEQLDAITRRNAEQGENVPTNEASTEQGNANSPIGRSMTEEEASSFIDRITTEAEVAPELELTPENWLAEFGENGIVQTPLGEVKMGEHQYLKLAKQGRDGKLGMIKPTLTNPDLILEDSSSTDDGEERASSYIFIKAFTGKDGERVYYFTSVTVRRDGQEVVISNQEKRVNRISKLLQNGAVAWINSGRLWMRADDASETSDVAQDLYSSQGTKVSDPTTEGTVASQSLPSAGKDSKSAEESEWDKLLELAEGDVELAQMSAEQKVVKGRDAVKLAEKNLSKKTKGDTPEEIVAEMKARKQALAKAQDDLAYWERVASVQAERAAQEAAVKAEAAQEAAERRGRAAQDGGLLEQHEPYTPIGHGSFGAIYTQFKGDAQGAISWLSKVKGGEALEALHHPDIGYIDLVWGEEGTAKSDGFGLAKLLKYHPEVLDDLQGILSSMSVVKKNANRVQLESKTHKASVRLTWDKENKSWLLTAFEKRETPVSTNSRTGVANNRSGKLDDTATQQNTGVSSEDKGRKKTVVAENGTTAPRTFTSSKDIQEAGLGQKFLHKNGSVVEITNVSGDGRLVKFLITKPDGSIEVRSRRTLEFLRPIENGVLSPLYESTKDSIEAQTTESHTSPTEKSPKKRLVTEERYQELAKRLRKKLGGQANMGVDPEILAIGLEMSIYHLENGVRKFADYAQAMIADLGDVARPYLKSFYNGARELPEVIENGFDADMDSYDEVKRFDVANFDKSTVDAMATAEQVVAEQEVTKQEEAAREAIGLKPSSKGKVATRKKKASKSKQEDVSLERSALPKAQKVDTIGFFEALSKYEEAKLSDHIIKEEVEQEPKTNEDETVQGLEERTSKGRRKRQSANKAEPLGGGERDSTEQPREERVDRGGGERSVDDGVRSGRIVAKPREQVIAPKNTRNNRNKVGAEVAPKSDEARYKANIEAIRTLKKLQESGEAASPKDMEVLRQFSGWGGLGTYFDWSGLNWANDPKTIAKQTLRDLLTEEEYDAANLSRNSAYFTPTAIIEQLWSVAEQLGFKGGSILECSAGVGSILGSMPQHISDRSNIEAVEIDPITGGMLELLYPDAEVHIQGFEDTRIADNSVDLAITNVPFVTGLSVFDKVDTDLSSKFRNIHDFAIAKNIRKLKQGGLGIFITSSGTLDKSHALRRWLIDHKGGNADVIGAFRLNNATFGGTSVTSDIIVVRKRVGLTKSPNAIDVQSVATAEVVAYENPQTEKVEHKRLDYNAYFIEHPEHMGGEMAFAFQKGETYRATSIGLYPKRGENQAQRLEAWVQNLNREELSETTESTEATTYERTEVAEGRILLDSAGRIAISQGGEAVPLSLDSRKVKGYSKEELVKDYLALKVAYDELIDYQLKHNDNLLAEYLDEFNQAYDHFVGRYGMLNHNTAISLLKADADFAGLTSIEKVYAKRDDSGKKVYTAEKREVFSRRVVNLQTVLSPRNVQEAVVASIHQEGRIDLPYIQGALGLSPEEITHEIISTGLGFENPISGHLEVRHEYLSGNVREKLALARAKNEGGRYTANIEALEQVLPMEIPAHLIKVTLGCTWLPGAMYQDFFKDKFDVSIREPRFVAGQWRFSDFTPSINSDKNKSAGVYSEKFEEYAHGHLLAQKAMEGLSYQFSHQKKNYSTGKSETVHDKEATQRAVQRIAELQEEFKEWFSNKLNTDTELAGRMVRLYNDKHNNYVPLRIDERFYPQNKQFEGMNNKFQLLEHQMQGAMRGIMQPLMLAHEVGSGKTFTLISSAMEMRRLGTAKKPMIVVQNSTVGQFVDSAKDLYPNAKILTIDPKERTPEGRKAFYGKIKNSDWDLIVVPQSVFNMMPDSPSRQEAFINERIEEKERQLELAREDKANPHIARQLEGELKALNRQREAAVSGGDNKQMEKSKSNAAARAKQQVHRKTDDVAYFEDMGVDALLIDEAHNYKKLGFETNAFQIKGIDKARSQQAANLYIKTRTIFEKVGWRNVVFATGTPISNTAAELYTFMRYLMPTDVMEANGILHFDEFRKNFGEDTQSLEFTTSGKFKETTRFASYINLPELVRLWGIVSHTQLKSDSPELRTKQPETEEGGSKARDIFIDQTPELVDVMRAVRAELEQFEQLSGSEKKANSHIPLTMFGIAQLAAIDVRLVDMQAEYNPNSKTGVAIEETLRSLEETKDYKGTVALFSDRFQNKKRLDSKGKPFNLFEDIKSRLIERGVPEEQIVVMRSDMTDKQKLDIFERVNAGDVRVIMGSTSTLGVGVNIQERLHTLIHIDAPTRPMDYEQRNGRILRQGNMHKEWDKRVRLLRLGVKDTLDVTAYQRLKIKEAFIRSVMDGGKLLDNNQEHRTLEEEEEGVFDNPVAQLSGSQYALLRQQAERELRRLRGKYIQYEQDQKYIAYQLKENAKIAERSQAIIERQEEVLATIAKLFPNGEPKQIVFSGQKYKPEQLGDALKEVANKVISEKREQIKVNSSATEESIWFDFSVDGIEGRLKVHFTRSSEYKNGTTAIKVSSKMTYSLPRLGIADRAVSGGYAATAFKDITEEILSGNHAHAAISRAKSELERIERDNSSMREREGKPFEFHKDIEVAEQRFEELTELMRQELEAKEAEYADKGTGQTIVLDNDLEDEAGGDDGIRYREEVFLEAIQQEDIRFGQGDAGLVSLENANDNKQAVSALPLDTEVAVVEVPSIGLTYDEAVEAIDELPSQIDARHTPDGVATLRIGRQTRRKLKSTLGTIPSELRGAYMDMLPQLEEVLSASVLLEEHRDRVKNAAGKRLAENESDPNIDKVQRLYGAVRVGDEVYRVKTTVQVFTDKGAGSKLHYYDVTRIELLSPLASETSIDSLHSGTNNSIPELPTSIPETTFNGGQQRKPIDNSIVLAKLIEGVELSYSDGALLSEAMEQARIKTEEAEQTRLRSEADKAIEMRRAQAEARAEAKRKYGERAEELGRELGVGVRVVTDVRELPARARRAKGWFDTKNGEVVLVAHNATSIEDVEATIYHEVVGHKGLREVVGGKQFDQFLHEVYRGMSAEARAKVTADFLSSKYRSLEEATEEYIARLAEGSFAQERSLWRKVVDGLRALLREVFGSRVGFTDNDLRYMLWRSYQRRKGEGVLAEAEALDMQRQLGVGLFRTSESKTLQEVNDRFNEQLEGLTEENADKVVLSLGSPSAILRSAGVADKPMKLYGNKVMKKVRKHGFSVSELRNLPEAVANPIAVFDNLGREGNRSILTELRTEQGNFLVTIDLGKGETDVDFNIVSSVFGKSSDNIIDWIETGKATYINKRKALNYLHHSALHAVTLDKTRLSSAAKVIKEFENPRGGTKSYRGNRYRLGAKARRQYEEQIRRKNPNISEEALQESLDFLHELEESKENTKAIKVAVKWLSTDAIRLPFAMDNVRKAIALAEQHKIDPMQFASPMEIIERYYTDMEYGATVDPDKEEALTGKRKVGDVFIYDVEDSPRGQEAVCRIAHAHFGWSNSASNSKQPWCLAGFTRSGKPTQSAQNFWFDTYTSVGKKIAFMDGKPIAFMAHNKEYEGDLWWNLQDEASNNLPLPDGQYLEPDGSLSRYKKGTDEDGWEDDLDTYRDDALQRVVRYFDAEERRDIAVSVRDAGDLPSYVTDELEGIEDWDNISDEAFVDIYKYYVEEVSEDPFEDEELIRSEQEELWQENGAGEYEDLRYRDGDELEAINDRFNEQLEAFDRGELKEALNFGKPTGWLSRLSLPSSEDMKMSLSDLRKHLDKHQLSTNDIRNLPLALSDPLLVYEWGTKSPSLVVVTSIPRGEERIAVALRLSRNGQVLDVNEIASIHGKASERFLQEMQTAKAGGIAEALRLVPNKQKALEWLGLVPPKGTASLNNQGLDDIAKIVQAFENPSVADDGVRYRDGESGAEIRAGQAQAEYNRAVRVTDKHGKKSGTANLAHRLHEAYRDSMLSLKRLQEAVAREVGRPIEDHENAYLAENSMSSKNKAQAEAYERDYFAPITREVMRIVGKEGVRYADVKAYMYAKHGLERNVYYSRKAAEDAVAELRELHPDATEAKLKKMVGDSKRLSKMIDARSLAWNGVVRDYSGLSALTESETEFTKKAEELVAEFEAEHKTDELWRLVRKATDATLTENLKAGLMDKATYDKVRGMFTHYIPLRGWDETTADEVYDYLGSSKPMLAPTLKTVRGRKSLADDPIATLAYMGQRAIVAGNRNRMKQRFLALALNTKTSLLTVGQRWYVQDGTTGKWEAASPEIAEDASPQEIEEALSRFEERMQELKKQGLAMQNHKRMRREGLKLGYRASKAEGREHEVRVIVGGREYVVYVNGNPRAAQAINGLTNPNRHDANPGWEYRAYLTVKHGMAQMFTSRNPAFVFTNLERDIAWATTAVAVKEDFDYNTQYLANIARLGYRGRTLGLLKRWSAGSLGRATDPKERELEQHFEDFLLYGGETGFTQINNVDEYKRKIGRMMNDAEGFGSKWGVRHVRHGWGSAMDAIELGNRAAEDMTRFAVFLTSREMGRSIDRAISDAKEITVNFNRKGSGEYGARAFNLAYLFFNATVQSGANLISIVRAGGKKAAIGAAAYFGIGAMQPLLYSAVAGMFGGDPEEYYDIPEWVRRNNLVFYLPFEGGYATLPLPHELRGIFGAGELSTAVLMGQEEVWPAVWKTAEGLTGVLPWDFSGNGGDILTNIAPSVLQPGVQIMQNTNYFGMPIYKDSDYLRDYPEWKTAYKRTNSWLVAASRWLNELGGGDNVKSSGTDWLNPGITEHLYESYTGGTGKFVNDIIKTASMPFDESKRSVNNVPIINKFIHQLDDRMERRLERKWRLIESEVERTGHLMEGYRREMLDRSKPKEERDLYKQKYKELRASYEGQRYRLAKGKVQQARDLSKEQQELRSEEARARASERLSRLKEQLLGRLAQMEEERERS